MALLADEVWSMERNSESGDGEATSAIVLRFFEMLARDPELRDAYRSDPDRVLRGVPLPDEVKATLKTGCGNRIGHLFPTIHHGI